MDKISKFLKRLTLKERKQIEEIISKVLRGDFSELDIKKLKGSRSIFRVRKGSVRIIFLKQEKDINIVSIERRSDTTYK